MAEKMIAYCGLICTQCPAFLATKTNDRAQAEATAELWSRQYQVEVKVDDVWCDGCLVAGKKCAHCTECEIRACGQERAVENCALCDEYPCQQLSGFFKMVPDAKKTLDGIRAAR